MAKDSYFVFTDESGVYQQNPSEKHIRSNPFYVRSYVLISVDDYQQYQKDIKEINREYNISLFDEIKWADLRLKINDKPRSNIVTRLTVEQLKSYYHKIFDIASSKKSIRFMFTATKIAKETCNNKSDTVFRFHLQDAFQRIQMDMRSIDGFAVFVMDELNSKTIRQVKDACYDFTMRGDFVRYDNIYRGILVENSLQSVGVQLADYAAGIMNGYLCRKIISLNKYQFATDLFDKFIESRLRLNVNKSVVGYSIIDIPKKTSFRKDLESIFRPQCELVANAI